jgi:hypothetical protein
MELTLTRALNEVKLLEKKIEKYSLSNATWVAISKNGKIGEHDVNVLKSNADANKQSLVDLILRRNKIKRSILKANNETILNVSDESYTIAEAIDLKNFILIEEKVFRNIRRHISDVEFDYERRMQELDNLVERTVNQTIQSDGKKDASVIAGIEKYVRDSNKISLEDPSKIKEWVDIKLEEIEEFKNEIDFSLSEINAKTIIYVH